MKYILYPYINNIHNKNYFIPKTVSSRTHYSTKNTTNCFLSSSSYEGKKQPSSSYEGHCCFKSFHHLSLNKCRAFIFFIRNTGIFQSFFVRANPLFGPSDTPAMTGKLSKKQINRT